MHDEGWRFDNSYARLPEIFYTEQPPVPVRTPKMAIFNRALAASMGLNADLLDGDRGAQLLGGNEVPAGAKPLAQAYAGHQFGGFTMLGDGRAILLGEHLTPAGERLDVQLKGSGATRFSRRGDGRAALGPMLREYIISEAMHALGLPTTRSLAVVATGEPVYREESLPGAVLTRIAASHIRVGTFQFAAATREPGALQALADYTLHRHYPHLADAENRYLQFLEHVIERQASLIAKWLLIGFIHGVMNTDNMAVSGETIDYGPCAFMDVYDSATVFSSIDRNGRYAFENQPGIAQWNLTRLAETLLPLFHEEEEKAIELARGALETFPERFGRHWLAGMRSKLGLFTEEEGDADLANALLALMQTSRADYTNTFRALTSDDAVETSLSNADGFTQWRTKWQERLKQQPQSADEVAHLMRCANPAVIPRNHKVEEALDAATGGDLDPLHRLLAALANPYESRPEQAEYTPPAPEGCGRYQTFCGT